MIAFRLASDGLSSFSIGQIFLGLMPVSMDELEYGKHRNCET
jgi:hypothetical protein